MSMEEVAGQAGHKVLTEVDDNIALVVVDSIGIFGQETVVNTNFLHLNLLIGHIIKTKTKNARICDFFGEQAAML
jgi:hypothetical protein